MDEMDRHIRVLEHCGHYVIRDPIDVDELGDSDVEVVPHIG
jgi:hypothetical protein